MQSTSRRGRSNSSSQEDEQTTSSRPSVHEFDDAEIFADNKRRNEDKIWMQETIEMSRCLSRFKGDMFRDDYPSIRCKDYKGTVQAFDGVRPVYHHEGHYRRYEPETTQIEGYNRENLSLSFSPPTQRRTVSLYKETTPYE